MSIDSRSRGIVGSHDQWPRMRDEVKEYNSGVHCTHAVLLGEATG